MDFATCSMLEVWEFAQDYSWDELTDFRNRPSWMDGSGYSIRAREVRESDDFTFVIEREGPNGTTWITWAGDPWEP